MKDIKIKLVNTENVFYCILNSLLYVTIIYTSEAFAAAVSVWWTHNTVVCHYINSSQLHPR